MDIRERLNQVKSILPATVTLIAVSKFHPEADVEDAYAAGQRIFGENIVQELRRKYENLPKDIQWHFIGHLQRNKIKYIVPFVSMIHAVDSFELLSDINQHAQKIGRVIPCLLQIHVAKEETKFGFNFEECRQMLKNENWKKLENVRIDGLMCMASNVPDEAQIHQEFHSVWNFFNEMKQQYFEHDEHFCQRSWGMSSDYTIAVQEGSTMVRVGTKIFGNRLQKTE
ncbi:MAG: YggS family pyridoxal phosphate-dependent enzyme [Bacteroidaceae bacterium]|jgi:pyridoxal phosphate enzyme (YggS family)|nr:YggS family pyridoxal phosphate-dependent enzyme [Bacteroidaceae bacterium]